MPENFAYSFRLPANGSGSSTNLRLVENYRSEL